MTHLTKKKHLRDYFHKIYIYTHTLEILTRKKKNKNQVEIISPTDYLHMIIIPKKKVKSKVDMTINPKKSKKQSGQHKSDKFSF